MPRRRDSRRADAGRVLRAAGCPDGYYRDPLIPSRCINYAAPPEYHVGRGLEHESRADVVQELNSRCSNGDNQSCTDLGGIYLRGAIVERDARRAESYLGRACKHGHVDGCDLLATAYASDVDLEDAKRAEATRQRACELRGGCKTTPPAPAPADGPATAEPGADVLIGSGTCFAISDDGLIVTAAHVVEGAEEVVVRFGEEKLLPATVEAKSSAVDVAVLKVDRKTKDYARVVADPSIALGDKIFTVGFPRPQELGPLVESRMSDKEGRSDADLAMPGQASAVRSSRRGLDTDDHWWVSAPTQ